MDKLAGFLDSISKPRFEEDFVDRLNYRVTGYLLLASAITLSAKEYVGKPVQCWVPAQFQGGWEEYVEDYCFVENTYWVPMYDSLPETVYEREERQLSYYQWVPFVLALQALMFNIPHILWRMLNWLSGIQVRAIITMAANPGDLSGTKVSDTMKMIARHIKAAQTMSAKQSLSRSSNPAAWIARWSSALLGCYLTATYLFIKILFIINCILQFVLLNAFLGTSYKYWGAEILSDLIAGRDWFDTGHFPRVTMCDVEVRTKGNIHRWSIQCVLMINMFNEKIYLFLWWWFLLVAILTILNFGYWLVISVVPYFSTDFISRYLRYKGKDTSGSRQLERFVRGTLHHDGVTILRLLSDNCGDLITAEIVAHLWDIRFPAKPGPTPKQDDQHPPSYNGTAPALAANDEKLRLLDSDDSTGGDKEFHEHSQ